MNFTAQKPDSIKKMFGNVAKKYDLANNILSLGIHHHWRQQLIKLSLAKSGDKILDCATGTGDLAFAFSQVLQGKGHITATDFCNEMLTEAKKKNHNHPTPIVFEIADVMDLKYPDHTFDLVTISFGIRNVSNPLSGITEMARVTKPGGKVVILEFGQPKHLALSHVYSIYSRYILPRLGGLITKQHEAYKYLQTSAEKFPAGEHFVSLMKASEKFKNIQVHCLMGGIAYIYLGEVTLPSSTPSS